MGGIEFDQELHALGERHGVPSHTMRQALAWWVVAELVRRHPGQLRVLETHPGGGLYDCVSVYRRGSVEEPEILPVVHLCKQGGPVHLTHGHWGEDSGGDERFNWLEVLLSPDRREYVVRQLERVEGLSSPPQTPATTSASIGPRLIAAFLSRVALGRDRWVMLGGVDEGYFGPAPRSGLFAAFPDTEKARQERVDGDLVAPENRFWFLCRTTSPDEVHPLAVIDVVHGRLWTSRLTRVDLMASYEACGRSIDALVSEVLPPSRLSAPPPPGTPPAHQPMSGETTTAAVSVSTPAAPEAASLTGLALSVARCPEVDAARVDPVHPCYQIVSLQSGEPAQWQVPEGWAGALLSGRIVFVSSNPSISEAGDHQSGEHVERYPRGDWSDEAVADFVIHRFNPDHGWATPDGRFLREDGSYSPKPVKFWVGVRKLASELLGGPADPGQDYVMTEVVHCKSKGEQGVPTAAPLCAQRHLDAILAASPAPLVVVVGAKARNLLADPWDLPAGFGQKSTVGTDEAVNLASRVLGGRQRVVAYAWHPSGMTGPKSMSGAYPTRLPVIRDLAQGHLDPEGFASTISA